jgi:death on curing protein
MIEPAWIDIDDVYELHNEVIARSGGSYGVLNQGALESTLNKPKNLHYYNDSVSLFDLAASYGYGLAKNHCFIDGNKRIAFSISSLFLLINGIELIASDFDAIQVFLNLAASSSNQEEDTRQLSNWLRLNSVLVSDQL